MNNMQEYCDIANKTKFCMVEINNVYQAAHVFGHFTNRRETPILCHVQRPYCKCCVIVPAGCSALVAHNGEAVGLWLPGFHTASCFTYVQFLVTQRAVVYDLPIKGVLTADNIMIKIDVCTVLQIKESYDDIKNFAYRSSPMDLTAIMEAALSERVRVLARGKTHLDAYSIKGKSHTQEMVHSLNLVVENKGVTVKSIIITNVELPKDIAEMLEEKTTYQSKNNLEINRHRFQLLILRNEQEIELIKQKNEEKRNAEYEKFKKAVSSVDRDHKMVLAETDMKVGIMHEKTAQFVNALNIKGELKAEEIKADTIKVSAKIAAQGKGEAARIHTENGTHIKVIESEIVYNVSERKGKVKEMEGETEGNVGKMLENKRKFDLNMRKLAIVDSLATNPNLSIYGSNQESLLANIETFKHAKIL